MEALKKRRWAREAVVVVFGDGGTEAYGGWGWGRGRERKKDSIRVDRFSLAFKA